MLSMSRNVGRTPSSRSFSRDRFVKTAFHKNISAASMFRPASLLRVDVSSRIASTHRCFVSQRSAASMFRFAVVRSIDVSSRIALQHRCFVPYRSTESMFCPASLHRINVSSRIAPQHRCFVSQRSATSMFRPASLSSIDSEERRRSRVTYHFRMYPQSDTPHLLSNSTLRLKPPHQTQSTMLRINHGHYRD